MRVLVADDSLISRRMLETALRKWDYEVVLATNGEEAWEYLQREDAPRLAILDWMMPGLSGPEVCRRVRERGGERYIYILLVTSRKQPADLIAGMEAGADDYITKPFDQNELKVRLGPGRRIVQLQDALFKARAELTRQATTDVLTELWNRRFILETLDRELERVARDSTPLGVVMGDLDRFKLVNDNYGHLAGDHVLKEVARRMKESSRHYDALGRYGGEEFLLILPGCDGEAAAAQAQRMRMEIERRPVAVGDYALSITCSFGVTAVPLGFRVEADAVIKTADEALYLAKQQGRNRVFQLPLKNVTVDAAHR